MKLTVAGTFSGLSLSDSFFLASSSFLREILYTEKESLRGPKVTSNEPTRVPPERLGVFYPDISV